MAQNSVSSYEIVSREIVELLRANNSVTVISHYNPDSDAYGSALGIALALKAQNKDVQILNESGVLPRYEYFPQLGLISKTDRPRSEDVVIVCDCGDLKRVGDSYVESVRKSKCIINIDHHSSNDHFGHKNLVKVEASSTSEIIFDLLTEGAFPITKEVATCLLAGIIGDSGSFRYSSTTPHTFRVAARLIELGAPLTALCDAMFANTAFETVKLQSEALTNIELLFEGRYAEVLVGADMMKRAGATMEDTDGLVERARDIKGVEISASIRQDESIWRVSLRSVSQNLDVSTVAAQFGGGGHKQAAAFRSKKDLEAIRTKLRAEVYKLLNR